MLVPFGIFFRCAKVRSSRVILWFIKGAFVDHFPSYSNGFVPECIKIPPGPAIEKLPDKR
jgi:hypothetical protein